MEYKVGDWVKCPGKGRIHWVYGWVVVKNATTVGKRYLVNRGYLGLAWYGGELSPAHEPDQPPETKGGTGR